MTHVKMNLPFQYKADVVLPGRRKPDTRSFVEWCDVEIESVSDSQAPIAARWREMHKVKRIEYSRLVRSYSDGFYAPADEFSMKGILTIDNQDDEAWITEKTHPMIDAEVLEEIAVHKFFGVGDSHPSDFKHQQNNQREKYFDWFMKNVKRHIFVDGDLYQRVFEPILTVSFTPIGDNDVAVIKIQQFEDVDQMARLDGSVASNFFRFSFGETEALDDFIAMRSKDYSATFFQRQNQYSSLEIALPDAFRIDLCSKDCTAFSLLLLEAASSLQKQDTRTIRRFADLKDAYNAEVRSPSSETSDALLTAMGNYAEMSGDFYNGISQALIERNSMRPIFSFGAKR